MKAPLLQADGVQQPEATPPDTRVEPQMPKRLRGGADTESVEMISLCIRGCCVLVFGIAVLCVALSRNGGCDYDALKNVEPPYGGELLPPNFLLVEQQQWFQFTKKVDVYDAANGKLVGYFYDMNFLLFMRFGFSDASDRIWFEAKYKSFWSRFKFQIEYLLERCDVGQSYDERWGGIFDVQEDWWARPWFCFSNCFKLFHLSRADAKDPNMRFKKEADVIYNSTLVRQSYAFRHEWYMKMTSATDGSTAAWAQQHFYWGGKFGLSLLSNWTVDVKRVNPKLPNWIIAFMAALDDIEEDSN